jgi:hypothetical protein
MKDIRRALSRLIADTGTNGYRRWYTPGLFETHVAGMLPKELRVIAPPPKKEDNYNCFIYALGLHRRHDVLRESKGFIYSAFLETLIAKGELAIARKPVVGGMILYRNPRRYGKGFAHAGVVQKDGSIVSKWSWGPLIRHAVFDVPQSYGSDIIHVGHVSPGKAYRLWKAYGEVAGRH